MRRKSIGGFLGFSLIGALLAAHAALAATQPAKSALPAGGSMDAKAGSKAAAKASPQEGTKENPNRYVHQGVVIEFEAEPEGRAQPTSGLTEGELADVRFKLKSESSGEPLRGTVPAAWMDLAQVIRGKEGAQQKSCKDKIALYLQGAVGIRPMVDLNSYFVLVLNKEPSITVVDPVVSMRGMTSTYARVPLKKPGMDWANSDARKRLFVTMPEAGQVAVIETDNFKLEASIDAGTKPMRAALQPDGRYLWVGNDAEQDDTSGVSVIDSESLKNLGFIATGKGHHEIAFTGDSRRAFVTNRGAGSVSVIDVASRKKLKDVDTGPLPISIAYSPLAKAIYVADGKDGSITVIEPGRMEIVKRIAAKPGLGPLRFTPDGRWGLVVNPGEDAVLVIDASTNELVHTITVKGQPYQLSISEAFAYVRSLESERVSMIALRSLGPGNTPTVQSIPVGAVGPAAAGDLPLADSITAARTEAAVFIVNPSDNTTYYYMEGMNSPSSNYQSYGASARAVTLVDRSLKEVEPGVYAAKVKIPAAGRYDVAFLLDSPRILHCFTAEAKPNPRVHKDLPAIKIEFSAERKVKAGGDAVVSFKLTDPVTGEPRTDLRGVSVMSYRAPGRNRTEMPAEELGKGQYRVKLPVKNAGAYYVYVAVRSEKVTYGTIPFFSFLATRDDSHASAPVRDPGQKP